MYILIINELYSCGGAEEVARLEESLFSLNDISATLLTFDYNNNYHYSKSHLNIPVKPSHKDRIVKYNKYYSHTITILSKLIPDAIHIHNLVNGSAGVLKAIEDYKRKSSKKVVVFQTLHDFGCICPRSWCTDGKGSICSGYKNNSCHKRCSIGFSDSLRLFLLDDLNRRRNSIIDFFITPSECLTSLARLNGFNAYTVSNPFDASLVMSSNSHKCVGDFLYFGRIGVRKGVLNLLRVWPHFSATHSNARLSFVGAIEKDIRDAFLREVSEQESVVYEGEMEHGRMLERIGSAWCVVVPSIWMENSPNTVRESLCLGTLTIGSRRGGIPEMISDDRLLFNPFNSDSMIDCLEFSFNLNVDTYDYLVSNLQRTLLNLSSPKRYIDSVMSLYSNFVI